MEQGHEKKSQGVALAHSQRHPHKRGRVRWPAGCFHINFAQNWTGKILTCNQAGIYLHEYIRRVHSDRAPVSPETSSVTLITQAPDAFVQKKASVL